jgi:hypothetical protein
VVTPGSSGKMRCQNWYACDGIRCPRGCGCVTSQTCANG